MQNVMILMLKSVLYNMLKVVIQKMKRRLWSDILLETDILNYSIKNRWGKQYPIKTICVLSRFEKNSFHKIDLRFPIEHRGETKQIKIKS